MKYRFILSYKPTEGEGELTYTASPIYGNDPNISLDRKQDEWYYTRKLNGKFTFERADFSWIMAREFDGTYTMTVESSVDGITWSEYFKGSFSQANLEIDLDNSKAVLDGLSEGTYNVIENARREEYDLRKIIPDTEAKEVQGQIHPALAMVDYRSLNIDESNIFCGGAATGNGYKDGMNDWSATKDVRSNSSWLLKNVLVEAKVTMINHSSVCEGTYMGVGSYATDTQQGNQGQTFTIHSYEANLRKDPTLLYNQTPSLHVSVGISSANQIFVSASLYDNNGVYIDGAIEAVGYNTTNFYSPASFVFTGNYAFAKIEIIYHYIRATLLTQSLVGVQNNVLDTGPYYKGMSAFEGSGLTIQMSLRTVDQPNGHNMVPGTDGQYFAPPDDVQLWHPLAESNWNYASMWYTIEPTVQNGLLDPAKIGEWRWTRCWTVGTCLKYLLKKITSDKVVFEESDFYSQFLYDSINPVAQGEQFSWLVCQKSDVMRPEGSGSTRCIVTLDWFLELLRNAFNCYWWLQKRNDGRYDFHIEHVEYFRRGNSYTDTLDDPTRQLIDITKIKTLKNFMRGGVPAKRLSDQTNRYTFDLNNMSEKYTFAWQGEGGSDEFKGFPMIFKAGWIEAGTSESHEVDNIFADLDWLALNAGSNTESSKNYDGLFIFSGYQPNNDFYWKENEHPDSQMLTVAEGRHLTAFMDIWFTAPVGYMVSLDNDGVMTPYIGTGQPQVISLMVDEFYIVGSHYIRIDFGQGYLDVVINRVHINYGGGNNVYLVPNTASRLHPGESIYLQNGPLAWPSLQNEYLHYDIPAAKWSFDSDDPETATYNGGGTVKLIKKQSVGVLPVPDINTEERLWQGVRTGLGTGILDSAIVNFSSRNAELTLVFDITPIV